MNTELTSVLSAALLYDIGRFLHKAYDNDAPLQASSLFVSENKASFLDPTLVEALTQHRFDSKTSTHNGTSQLPGNDRHQVLASLIAKAHLLSSTEESKGSNRVATTSFEDLAPLDSVFSLVDIGLGTRTNPDEKWIYRLSPLYEGTTFPQKLPDGFTHPEEDYKAYANGFVREFKQLLEYPHERMEDTLLSLIQRYLWCLPHNTEKKPRDISMADHLKVATALTACFYKFYDERGWNESKLSDDSVVKAVLVSGDISGIQDYIYGIASVGAGGVAKRLRARSFRVAMLTEVIALRLLEALNLPLACKIMAAGGQFYLLIPKTKDAETRRSNEIQSISKWLLEEYQGDLAVSFAWTELPDAELQQGSFDKTLDRLREQMAASKSRKFEETLGEGPKVFEQNFEGRGACIACQKQPANHSAELCKACALDEILGRKLAGEDPLWYVISTERREDSVKYFGEWHGSLCTEDDVKNQQPLIAYNLRGSSLLPGVRCAFSTVAGYVPRWSAEEYEAKKASVDDEFDPSVVEQGHAVKSFSALAAESTGAGLLSVLRADVDNLGLIFTLGTRDIASISRASTLSTFMNIFFSWEVVRLIEENYPNTYVAYAGGDDLMLVGPWDNMIDLADEIRRRFSEFTGMNPNLTLSAGVGTFGPRTPIAVTSKQTGEILETAKSRGRNRLTLFGTTIPWDKFEHIREWADIMTSAMSEGDAENKVSKSLLYRLLSYQRAATAYFSARDGRVDARSALFRSHLAYDIGRNLPAEKELSGATANLREMLARLISADENEWQLMLAPITWSLYRLRKE